MKTNSDYKAMQALADGYKTLLEDTLTISFDKIQDLRNELADEKIKVKNYGNENDRLSFIINKQPVIEQPNTTYTPSIINDMKLAYKEVCILELEEENERLKKQIDDFTEENKHLIYRNIQVCKQLKTNYSEIRELKEMLYLCNDEHIMLKDKIKVLKTQLTHLQNLPTNFKIIEFKRPT